MHIVQHEMNKQASNPSNTNNSANTFKNEKSKSKILTTNFYDQNSCSNSKEKRNTINSLSIQGNNNKNIVSDKILQKVLPNSTSTKDANNIKRKNTGGTKNSDRQKSGLRIRLNPNAIQKVINSSKDHSGQVKGSKIHTTNIDNIINLHHSAQPKQ